MARTWMVGVVAVLLPVGCRVAPRTVTEGTAVIRPALPGRQPEAIASFDEESSLSEGLEMYLAATPPRGLDSVRLRNRMVSVLTRRLERKLGDRALRSLFESSLLLLRRPAPVSGGPEAASLLLASSSLSPMVRSLLSRAADRILERFEPRGDVFWSLLGHAVAVYVGNRPGFHRKRFVTILGWLSATRSQKGRGASVAAVLSQLQKTAGRLPSPMVLSVLKRWGLKAAETGDPALEPSLVAAMAPLLSGNITAALAALSGLARQDKLLRSLLERTAAKGALAVDYLALSHFYQEEHPRVSEMVCRMAAVRFPKSAVPWFCLGELAESEHHALRAMADYERALRLNPGWWTVWNKLAAAYMSRIATLVGRQDFGALAHMLDLNVAFHKAAQARWPAKSLDVDMAAVYYASGQALAAQGRMAGAARAYSSSLKYRRRPMVLVELGNIAFWRRQYRKALKYYKQTIESVPDDGRRIYWLSKVALAMARCHRRLGDRRQARFVLVKAAGSILRLSTLLRDKTVRAGLLVSVAEIVDALGRRDHALRLLDIAVDTAGSLEGIYSRVMTFYVSRGLVDQALDLYTRVTTQQIAEYHRAYATFWVLDLGRRCNVESVRLSSARSALDALRGHHWYDRLAAWMRGDISDAQVARYAKRPGDRLELKYYQAMKYLGAGHVEKAKQLWREIEKTHMYAYFEYRMADWYLRHGAPCPRQVTPRPSAGRGGKKAASR